MTLAEPRSEVVAEVLVHLRPPALEDGSLRSRDRVWGLLHRTLDLTGQPSNVPGAAVRIRLESGEERILDESADPVVCGAEFGFDEPGTCYGGPVGPPFEPGRPLRLEITLPGGGTLVSRTTPPERIRLHAPDPSRCVLEPMETLELVWSRSEGSSAYIVEAAITGLSEHFDLDEVDVPDPLQILGLALSADDTTLAFPAEVGVFDRGDLDREVAVLLQEGLPAGTSAEVVVAAVDENYVNWVRGGNFNPSGPVRIPSVQGDGTGFFGSAASTGAFFEVADAGDSELPACGG